jgi:hypothetical protein
MRLSEPIRFPSRAKPAAWAVETMWRLVSVGPNAGSVRKTNSTAVQVIASRKPDPVRPASWRKLRSGHDLTPAFGRRGRRHDAAITAAHVDDPGYSAVHVGRGSQAKRSTLDAGLRAGTVAMRAPGARTAIADPGAFVAVHP